MLAFFQWCYQTALGEGIRESTWLFPVFEAFHLIGLGVTVGAVLLVDLRLLGVGLSKQPASQLGHSVVPVGSHQVLLQFSVLGEDDLTAARATLRLHDSPPGRGYGLAAATHGTRHRSHLACAVVRGCLGRALDRVFLSRADRAHRGDHRGFAP